MRLQSRRQRRTLLYMPRKSVIVRTKLAPLPKVQRGYRPGIRGAAKTQTEIDAEQAAKANRLKEPMIVIRPPRENPLKGKPTGRPSPLSPEQRERGLELLRVERPEKSGLDRKANRVLSELIQAIGSEVVDPQTGWTRIAAVIRKLYIDAVSGKTPAAALLFERGWGKVPQPVSVDLQAEVTHIVLSALQAGVSPEEVLADPVLAKMAEDSGLVVDGKFVLPNLGSMPHLGGSGGE
jgi:hypothetical protein